jgi:hypothetical protein
MSPKRTIAAVAALATILLVPLAAQPPAAQQARVYPWCSANADGGASCAFASFEQCRQSAKLCERNPAYDASADAAGAYAAAPIRSKRTRK